MHKGAVLLVDQLSIFANFQFSIIDDWLDILFTVSADIVACLLSSNLISDARIIISCVYTAWNGAVGSSSLLQ